MKLLLTSDWQIRDDVPVARTDNFFKEMSRKVSWIVDEAIERECEYIIHSGDLFDKGRPVHAQMLETLMMRLLEPWTSGRRESDSSFLIVPGNHDLPYHNLEYLPRSSLGVLAEAGYVKLIHDEGCYPIGASIFVVGIPWGSEFRHWMFTTERERPEFLIGVWHGMVTHGGTVPGSVEAMQLLRDFPEYDLIVTGHNHDRFVVEYEGRVLVNPGSMMRETIDQIDYKPAVIIFDTDGGTVIKEEIPIAPDVISVSHKTEIQARDERIAIFVEQMKTEHDVGLSFEKNLQEHFAANDVSDDVEKIVWECMEVK